MPFASRLATGVILGALMAVPVTVMGQAADQSPIDIPFVKFVLPNGLTVITHEDRTARRLAAIGSADVSRVAARLIQPERLSWLVIGDEKATANGVAALNLGKIRHITADGIHRSETR